MRREHEADTPVLEVVAEPLV